MALAESGGFLNSLDLKLEHPGGRETDLQRNVYAWNVARELVRQHSKNGQVAGAHAVGRTAKAYGFGRQLQRYLNGDKKIDIKKFEQRIRESAFSKWDLEQAPVKQKSVKQTLSCPDKSTHCPSSIPAVVVKLRCGAWALETGQQMCRARRG